MVPDRNGSLSSSCLSLVGLTMEKLKSLGQYEDNADVTILIGRKKATPEGIDPGKLVLVGDCLKMLRSKGIFVEGCPPGEPSPHWAIVDRRFPAFDLRDPSAGLAIRQRGANETPRLMEHIRRLKAIWDKEQTGKKQKRRDSL